MVAICSIVKALNKSNTFTCSTIRILSPNGKKQNELGNLVQHPGCELKAASFKSSHVPLANGSPIKFINSKLFGNHSNRKRIGCYKY